MSRLATVYNNDCSFCGTQNPGFSSQEYCNSNCERQHNNKLERHAKKKNKKKILWEKIQELEDRISVLENKIDQSN